MHLTRKAFDRLVEDAIAGFPDEFAQWLDEVPVIVEDRPGKGDPLPGGADEDAPVAQLVEQVVAELQSIVPERTIETEVRIARPVNIDPARVAQMLSNLLGNAITHGAESAPVRVSATTEDGEFRLCVANGGVPISPDTMMQLFQPFFRGKIRPSQQGLGLGLYISSEIAKAHNGTLSAESNDAETRFTFTMPLG